MRLQTWVKRRGRGALRQLAESTGLSYLTIVRVHGERQKPKHATAKLISRATHGAVSIDELCDPPRKR